MGYPLKFNAIRTEGLKHSETGGKFGSRARGSRGHKGWDFVAKVGTHVYAVGPGEIVFVSDQVPGYGTVVQLKFLRGSEYYWALYAHLSAILVKQGQRIDEGTVLGFTGATGNARGEPTHLHFEVATDASLKKGRTNQIDPAEVLGDFLRENPSGSAIAVERSYPYSAMSADELERAERRSRTA